MIDRDCPDITGELRRALLWRSKICSKRDSSESGWVRGERGATAAIEKGRKDELLKPRTAGLKYFIFQSSPNPLAKLD